MENQISMLIHQIAEIYMAVRRNEILYKSVKDESVVDHTFTNSSSEGHSVAHDISETIKLIKIWEFNDISIATQLEEKLHYLKQYY
ncbi:hypothetical protein L3i20_v225150 [Paenibacillus sp. L3-i20]|nr:hypothetical protein L3i20_v225150 [Paenibacillus sp. L3-i20]